MHGAEYVDTLTVRLDAPSAWSGRWWAESMFLGHTGHVGRFMIFRVMLALKPHRGDHIMAWRVAHETPEHIRLTREGRRVAAEILVAKDGSDVHLALAMTYRNALGRAVWERLAPVHRGEGVRILSAVRGDSPPARDLLSRRPPESDDRPSERCRAVGD